MKINFDLVNCVYVLIHVIFNYIVAVSSRALSLSFAATYNTPEVNKVK